MIRILAFALLIFIVSSKTQAEEKFFGSNVDARVTLAYKASESAIQKMLPDNFTLQPPEAGPAKGANIYVVMIDPQVVLDADGKPVDSQHAIVLAIPVKEKSSGETGPLIVGGFVLPSFAPGAYGVYASAKMQVERKITKDGRAIANETWAAQSEGRSLKIALEYERKLPTKSTIEQKVFAGGKPGFYRIYRFEQAADVVFSAPTNIDRKPKVSLQATGAPSDVFSSAQLIAVISIPWYGRKIFVPGP